MFPAWAHKPQQTLNDPMHSFVSQPQHWMSTGRTTPPLPPAAQTCASTYAGLAVTGPSRPSKATR